LFYVELRIIFDKKADFEISLLSFPGGVLSGRGDTTVEAARLVDSGKILPKSGSWFVYS